MVLGLGLALIVPVDTASKIKNLMKSLVNLHAQS